MSFNECEQVKFELTETFTWGGKKDKYSGYSIPVVVDDNETKTKIESLVEEHGAKNPLYGNTLYLKSKGLSEKQKKDLFNKGKSHIKVCFKVTGTYTKNDVNHLVFQVTKLSKVDKHELEASCPED